MGSFAQGSSCFIVSAKGGVVSYGAAMGASPLWAVFICVILSLAYGAPIVRRGHGCGPFLAPCPMGVLGVVVRGSRGLSVGVPVPGRPRVRAAVCPWRMVTGIARRVGVWRVRPIYVLSVFPR